MTIPESPIGRHRLTLEHIRNKIMKPNREEKVVIKSLAFQGFEDIVFEPDGNVPLDILVNGNIAIEVRRLNQNQEIGDRFQGLEQDEYSIYGLLRKIMIEVSEEDYEQSAFVGYSFNRPIPDKKIIKRKVLRILENHKEIINELKEHKVDENFLIKISPSTFRLQRQYQYGISRDGNTGGFVIGLIWDNLKLIIEEKERKVSKVRHKNNEWWLAVVDHIGYGLNDLDIEQFYELARLDFNFDRILLVSPLDAKKFNYLYE